MATTVSNEFVVAGKRPDVLLVDVVVEVVNRLVGVSGEQAGQQDEVATLNAGLAKTQRFIAVLKQGAAVTALPFRKGGRVVPVVVGAVRQYKQRDPATGRVEDRVDYEPFFEVLPDSQAEFMATYTQLPEGVPLKTAKIQTP